VSTFDSTLPSPLVADRDVLYGSVHSQLHWVTGTKLADCLEKWKVKMLVSKKPTCYAHIADTLVLNLAPK